MKWKRIRERVQRNQGKERREIKVKRGGNKNVKKRKTK